MNDTGSDAPAISFEWPAEEIRRVGRQVVELIADHLTRLPGEPVFRPVPPDAVDAFRAAPAPQHGMPIDDVLAAFARDVAPHPFGNGHPRFYAWVNSPPVVAGIFASALAAAMNPSVAGGNHAAVHLEHQVIRWFAELLGLPATTKGLLVSGTSGAAIVALGAARHAVCARRGWDVRTQGLRDGPDLVVYRTAEAHGCHQKAAELLGIGTASLRTVPVDDALRMRPDALEAMIADDVAAGRVPMAVIASAGTVNTGAIDPLDAIVEGCARHEVWLHVDGAYGAPAILLDEIAPSLGALGRADSVALDPHKWLYVPVDAALVLVRDGDRMRDAFSLVPPYLRIDGEERGVQGPPWFSEYGIEQTRPFRALKVCMALQHLGLDGYRTLIGRDVALARHLAAQVLVRQGFALWQPQGLSIVCFRLAPSALDDAAADALNRAVLLRVQLGGEAFLSSTVIGGRVWLRACIVNPRATTADVDRLLDVVASAAEEIAW